MTRVPVLDDPLSPTAGRWKRLPATRGAAERLAIACLKTSRSRAGFPDAELSLVRASTGAPVVRDDAGFLSLSYGGGCVAAVASATHCVGIDMEMGARVQRLQPASFTTEEERWVYGEGAETLATLWCAKEACVKVTRQGFRARPRTVGLRWVDEHTLSHDELDIRLRKVASPEGLACVVAAQGQSPPSSVIWIALTDLHSECNSPLGRT